MKFLKIASNIAGVLFVIAGIFLCLFVSALNDPEIEGESGRTRPSDYIIGIVAILLGTIILLISSRIWKKKNSN